MMYQMGVYCRLSKDDGENKVSEDVYKRQAPEWYCLLWDKHTKNEKKRH